MSIEILTIIGDEIEALMGMVADERAERSPELVSGLKRKGLLMRGLSTPHILTEEGRSAVERYQSAQRPDDGGRRSNW